MSVRGAATLALLCGGWMALGCGSKGPPSAKGKEAGGGGNDGSRAMDGGPKVPDAGLDRATTDGAGPGADSGQDGVTGTSRDAGDMDSNTRGSNLIENGDFSSGFSGWQFTDGTGTPVQVAVTVTDGTMCVDLPAGRTLYIGWPVGYPPFTLLAGTTYTFSFRLSLSQPQPAGTIYFGDKVGSTASPYSADFQSSESAMADNGLAVVPAGSYEFSHTFVSHGLSSGGVVLWFTGEPDTTTSSTACLSDVMLVLAAIPPG